MPLRFDIDYSSSDISWEPLVDEVFGELTSSFVEMTKGEGFIDYTVFEKGYQTLKQSTDAFENVTAEKVLEAVRRTPVSFAVFRSILGLTPPEWAYLTTEQTDLEVDQGSARTIDRKFRVNHLTPMDEGDGVTGQRVRAMIEAGVSLLAEGAGSTTPGIIHRLDKMDTEGGWKVCALLPDLAPLTRFCFMNAFSAGLLLRTGTLSANLWVK